MFGGEGGTVPAATGSPRAPLLVAVGRRGLWLVSLVTALEVTGLVVDLAGAEAALPWLSMDHPLALARWAVAGTLLAGGLTALAGSFLCPARRSWWSLVAIVLLAAALVKAAGVAHADILAGLELRDRPALAALGSGLAALAVLAVMWWSSRHERRDRRRLLGSLAGYAFAATGLSAVSSAVSQTVGPDAAAAALAVFVEEQGEATGAVLVLFAVLVGVAPGLVLGPHHPARRNGESPRRPRACAAPQQTVGGG